MSCIPGTGRLHQRITVRVGDLGRDGGGDGDGERAGQRARRGLVPYIN